jgi:hypothetical protein
MGALMEDHYPPIRRDGIQTNKPAIFNGLVTFNAGTSNAFAVLASAATVTITNSPANFSHTPTQSETINAPVQVAGKLIRLAITTSGVTSYTLTFGTGFKSTSTLSTGTTTAKVFTIEFVSDGTNYNEGSRTTAM